MSLLKALAVNETVENERDSLGGMSALESDAYLMTVALAYTQKSKGGALGLFVTFKTADGKDYKTAQYMTGGDSKGNKPYYQDKDGKNQYLPGFNVANALALLTCGKEISELDTEEKTVKLYSPDSKAEIPQQVQVVTELIGKSVYVGLVKQIVDKTKKNESTNVYEPTGETREENEIDKLFHAESKRTTTECRAESPTADFFDAWVAKNKGVTRDKAGKGGSGTSGAPKAGGAGGATGTPKPKSSLFA